MGTYKMISCLLMLSIGILASCYASQSLRFPLRDFALALWDNGENAIQKNSRTWHIMGMSAIQLRLKFVFSRIRVRPNARGYAISAFRYTFSSPSGLFQYI